MTEQEPTSAGETRDPERVPLSGDDGKAGRKRVVSGLVAVALLAAAFGGVAGFIGGQVAGLVVAGVVAAPLLLLVLSAARRRMWLEGTTVTVRTWGSRRLDLATVSRMDLLITDVRGTRTVSLLVTGGQRAAIKIDLAVYAGTGGRELGILPLRKLADAVVNNLDAGGLVFSQLLVAQLRSEARGDAAADRPLYRLASAAPSGKLAQRFSMEAVSRFVATLEG
ncbi:hypothetical protein ACWGRK_08020 [Saccharomonospora azurea]|uniref:Uncharacterized protein n=1 Tax=Saccharomonospora azurea NA-128 TaxID=882081 RepID=H8G6X5_9PSEU|nr:hypothetical protein [Saccharomonospora azurea]EHY91358.1 hypothetical protein SacazDRAFT_04525 [Saccharomonospora azurea NA-128]